MKYKIGDKVKIRKDLVPGNCYGKVYYASTMNKFKAMKCIVTDINDGIYNINNSEYWFSEEMLEVVDNEIILEYALRKLGMTKEELMLKRGEEMILRGKKIEDTLDLLKKQIDLLQKDKEDYRKDYINARQEVYKDEVVERLNKELEHYRNNSLQVLSDKEMLQFKEFKHSHYKSCRTSDVCVLLSPTGIGTIIKLKCPKCGKELDITDIDCW